MFAVACATPSPQSIEHEQRIERAGQGLEGDPTLEAHRAAVEAALANERRPKLVDAVELRVADDYLTDEHQIRALARVKLRHPVELRAERNALHAETEIEVARLEEAALSRRVALCFPSVDALVRDRQSTIYSDYAKRQKTLLKWNDDWRSSGVVDELSGAWFELDSRIKLATRQPPPVAEQARIPMRLPEIGAGGGELVRSPEHLRETVSEHHPSVELRRATAERYRRLGERSRARRLPGLRFVDVSYEHRTDASRDGVGAQLAFDIRRRGPGSAGLYEEPASGQVEPPRWSSDSRPAACCRALASCSEARRWAA